MNCNRFFYEQEKYPNVIESLLCLSPVRKTILRNIAFNYLSQHQLLQSFGSMLLVAGAFQVSFLVNRSKMNNINFRLTINLKLYFNKQQLSNECSSRRKVCHKKPLFSFLFYFLFSFFPFSFLVFFFFCTSASGYLVIPSNVIQFRIPGEFFSKDLLLR